MIVGAAGDFQYIKYGRMDILESLPLFQKIFLLFLFSFKGYYCSPVVETNLVIFD